jgi:hypothetical protein
MNNLNYVYGHVDPISGEILYIGMGKGARAWATGNSSGTHRKPDHKEWLQRLHLSGYTMGDITVIFQKMLSRNRAFSVEYEMIQDVKPVFNVVGNPDKHKSKKFTPEQALEALSLHEKGVRLCDIPRVIGIHSSNLSVLGLRMVSAGKLVKNKQ